jgi:[acyl-carrier-protein] S-malonyltransferase
MPRFALVFPGQGAQAVGMGRELSERFPESRSVFEEADEILGRRLSRLCFTGPADTLQLTEHAQPAILTTSIAALAALRARLGGASAILNPVATAGHSLGEFGALVAADSLDFPDALRLVAERGRLMADAGTSAPGRMVAVIGLDADRARDICVEASRGGVVVVANDNAPGQVVLSGSADAVESASQAAKAAGAKRVVPLAVSGAFHSPLMASAAREFAALLAATPFRDPRFPVVANTSAEVLVSVSAVREELERQLTGPVRWVETVGVLRELGVDAFLELGPGTVLTGLVKRVASGTTAASVGDAAGIERAAEIIVGAAAE